MSTTTPRIGLVMPDGPDLISRTAQLNANLDKIDDHIGAIACTSSTRPSTPYGGQIIYEEDTRKVQVRDSGNLGWVNVGVIPIVSIPADVTAPYNGQMVFGLAAGTLYRYQSSNTTWYRYPDVQNIYKATNESVTSSTTFQSDNDLVAAVVANSVYKMELYCPYDASTAGDLKVQFTGPALTTMAWTNFGVNSGGSLADYNVVVEGISAGGAARGMGGNGAAIMSFQAKGTVVVGANSGNITTQWAQETSSGTATRILAGSWMCLTRIA